MKLITGGKWAQSVSAAAATPELPRIYLDTNYVVPNGRTITVNAGSDLQAAINSAQPGDVLSLQAGATFTGNFTLPAKSGQGWIIIRTSTPDASLPSPGTRVTPQIATLMPKIVTPNAEAAVLTASGARNYRFIGVEIGIKAGVTTNYGIVKLGDASPAQNTLSVVPQDLIIDRCYIHGNSTGDVSRGIALNSGRTAVIDSFISECHGVGFDTQAICGWNGPGPYKIVNNYLEGAGENFMIGGADPSISGLIPSDIEFRNNYVYKPLRWKVGDPSYAGVHWSVKNIFELKNAQRVLIDSNVFENNWQDAQDGFAIVLKVQNQDGAATWTLTSDITFTNNTVRHSGAGINLLGIDPYQTSQQMRRILVRNNLWEDINGAAWGGTHGRWFQITGTPDVTVDHNTVFQSGDLIIAYGTPSLNFVYTNNIGASNSYGVKGDSVNSGNDTINMYFPGVVFTKDVLAGAPSTMYPANNYYPANLDAVGFVNRAGGDYRLSSTSPYRSAGTDGKDLGYLVGQSTSFTSPTPAPTVAPTATPTPTPKPTPTPTPAPTATPLPATVISGVAINSITASGATIAWATNTFTDSQVEYGPTTAYGFQTAINPTLITSHVMVLSGLAANTPYYFRVKSRNSAGVLAVSGNFGFQTASSLVKPVPTPMPTPVAATGTAVPVTWTKISGGLTVSGSVLAKTSGCDGCAATAISQQTISSGSGYLEFVATEIGKTRWIGLMQSQKTVSRANLDFAIVLGTEAAVYEQGRYKTEVPLRTGDVFRIAVGGGQVRYYKNGALFYTSSLPPGTPLVAGAFIDQVGGTVGNAVIFDGPSIQLVQLK